MTEDRQALWLNRFKYVATKFRQNLELDARRGVECLSIQPIYLYSPTLLAYHLGPRRRRRSS